MPRANRPDAGAYQRDNLLVAIRLLEEAKSAGLPVDLGRLADGLAATRWPGDPLQEGAADGPIPH